MSGMSFALLAFGTLLFTVVLAFLLLNMSQGAQRAASTRSPR